MALFTWRFTWAEAVAVAFDMSRKTGRRVRVSRFTDGSPVWMVEQR